MKLGTKITAFVVLAVLFVTVGCSASWLSEFNKYVGLAAPAVIDIIDIVALAQGKAADAGLVAKVNADAAAIERLAQDSASASAAAQPSVQAQLDAAVNTFMADSSAVFAVAHVNDPAKQAMIQNLVSLASNTIHQLEAMLPQAKAGRLQARPPLAASEFVASYNKILSAKTGDAKFDQAVSKKKLHLHSKFVRIVSFGRLQ